MVYYFTYFILLYENILTRNLGRGNILTWNLGRGNILTWNLGKGNQLDLSWRDYWDLNKEHGKHLNI